MLLNQSVQNYGQIKAFFARIREAQAPQKFTMQFLSDLGFTSSNYRAFVPLLKGLGFLSEDGAPKSEYMSLLDPTQWDKALGQAIKQKYSDIFTMKAKPSKGDKQAIIGKYKSTYNLTDLAAERAANTFLALLEAADIDSRISMQPPEVPVVPPKLEQHALSDARTEREIGSLPPVGLVYNIQIHLPATKDLEVYNAIFRSLRLHLIDG